MGQPRAVPIEAILEVPVAEDAAASAQPPAPAEAELPLDADPPETRHDPARLDLVLDRVLKRLGVAASPWLEQLAEAWPRILPAEAANMTRPGKWDKQILYVYVANSMRLFEVRRQYLPVIEQAVKKFAGDARVRAVRLTLDPG